MKEAQFYEKIEGLKVKCKLCPKGCVIPDSGIGVCHARINSGGTLYAGTYGHVSALALDPVEKKPLAHFFPGKYLLSAGSYGCNLSCRFCQNHEISQAGGSKGKKAGLFDTEMTLSPDQLVQAAIEVIPRLSIGIAYTYNEPLVGYEFVYDTAVCARTAGLRNVLVTNGFINPEPLKKILPFIDAMNIDLKSFNGSLYRKLCGGWQDPVLDCIRESASQCHVEVTTLILPGYNSSPAEIDSLSSWLADVSPDIPLHLTRHHPDYLMQEPAPVSVTELRSLAALAGKHLKHVHCGNI